MPQGRVVMCFGFRIFLLPQWFHVKAYRCLTMLLIGFPNVWPSHHIYSARNAYTLLQWFAKVWILLSVAMYMCSSIVVVFLVHSACSAPYSNTDLTVMSNRRIFVVSDYDGRPHVFKHVERCPCLSDPYIRCVCFVGDLNSTYSL